jgi:hypothetical protein
LPILAYLIETLLLLGFTSFILQVLAFDSLILLPLLTDSLYLGSFEVTDIPLFLERERTTLRSASLAESLMNLRVFAKVDLDRCML